MARRKNKRKAPRRYKGAINLVNTAEGLLVANQATRAFFGLDAITFATEGWLLPKTKTSLHSSAMGGGAWTQGITLSELFEGLIPGGKTSFATAPMSAYIKANLKTFGPRAALNSIAIPVAFRFGKKLSSSPRRMVNKGFRQLGLGNMVKV